MTGSVASLAYGEPRLTNDIDVVAGIRASDISELLAAFPAHDFYLSEEAILDAIRRQGQFNIIHPSSGLKVDVVVRKETPFDRSRFAWVRMLHLVESYQAAFASAEGKKMEGYREGGSEKHLRDITGMLKVSGDESDRAYLVERADRLGLRDIWDMIQQRMEELS